MSVWDLVGGDPAPGDPVVFEGLGRTFSDKATNAQSAGTSISRLIASIDASVWQGEAADAFRETMQELPPRLHVCHDAYATAAGLMVEYGRTLRGLQERARMALEKAVGADEELAQESGRTPYGSTPPAP